MDGWMDLLMGTGVTTALANAAHFCARQTQVANTILQRMYDDSSILGDVFTSKYLTMDLVQ